MEIFLSFEIPPEKQDDKEKEHPGESPIQVDRFKNKDQNFSINWYNSFSDYYNEYLKDRIELMNLLTNKGKKSEIEKSLKSQAEEQMRNPCFVIAHELYDALPVHQFHFTEQREWCEKVLIINAET